jgi:hypothetical protein
MAHFTRSGTSPWNVSVRDINLNEVETANGYFNLRMDLRESDVGQWTIRLPMNHPAVAHLLQPGSGIVVRPVGHDDVVMSGWTAEMFITETRADSTSVATGGEAGTGGATFVGFTDEVILTELAYPDPDVDVTESGLTTFGVAHDTRTGPAETVLKAYVEENIGPSAGILRRRYPFLNIPATTGLGASNTWAARFDSLLQLCHEIATYGGLSFRVVQSAPGQVSLEVYESQTLSEIRFSVNAGNLTSALLTYRAPDSTEGVAGLSGEGTARSFTRRQSNGISVLALDGASGNYASTPDHSSLDITGDLDIRVIFRLDQYPPASAQAFLGKWEQLSGQQQSYVVTVQPTGLVTFFWTTDGTDATQLSSAMATSITTMVRSDGTVGMRVTFDVNNGAGQKVVRFFELDEGGDINGPWSSRQTNTTAGTTSIFSSSAPLVAGAQDVSGGGVNNVSGIILAGQVRNGIDGTIVADVDFAKQAAGDTSFIDDTGKIWTVQGDAFLTGPPPVIENWGRRVVKFLDRRSDDTLGEAQRAIDTVLIDDAITAGMQLYPIEQEGTLYGVDYRLGDKVAAVVQGVELVEPVRRVVITHEPNKPVDVVPTVGLPIGDGESPEDAPLIRSMLRNLTSVTRS